MTATAAKAPGGFQCCRSGRVAHLVLSLDRSDDVWHYGPQWTDGRSPATGTPGPTLCGLTRFDERHRTTQAIIRRADLPGWSMGDDPSADRCVECWDLATPEHRAALVEKTRERYARTEETTMPDDTPEGATTGGFALRHDRLTAPPVHIPDGNGGAYKTELVIERTVDRTEKILWWHADDPRSEPHNHPWDFVSTILHGGYTEDRWYFVPDLPVVVPGDPAHPDNNENPPDRLHHVTLTRRADGTGDGDTNTVPRSVFHRVRDVLPGTVTHMVCGPAAPGNEWGYLDLDDPHPDRLIDPLTVYEDFPALLRAINPHLIPK